MYSILIRLMLLGALLQLGLKSEFTDCHSRQCLIKLEKASKQILHIDWRPISVFPEEAKRFK